MKKKSCFIDLINLKKCDRYLQPSNESENYYSVRYSRKKDNTEEIKVIDDSSDGTKYS